MRNIPIEKIEGCEQPIPTAWRSALKQISDKVALGRKIEGQANIEIGLIDNETELTHRYNIDSYPDALGPLNEESWETSIYIWDSPYWRVLIDLSDENGDTTDLVFHAKIYETSVGYLIEPGLIYVP